ncbi:MAG: hypothetical protein IPK13_04110 [Deltaproteobacteria bacterium]|nr:hypothetical protein [Deltaproteobacteria bacterium]
MSVDTLIFLGTAVGAVILVFVGFAFMVSKFYRKVEQGRALIINKISGKEPEVTFKGGLVLPIVHKAEIMDISVKTIEIDRRGKEGLICHDNIRADIKVTFFVKVNKDTDSVLKVASQVGCDRASQRETLEELFQAKFSEALKTVGKQLDFIDLYTQRDDFRDRIKKEIGQDLNGYSLEDAAIDFLEQTPIDALDKDNILDAQGIKKITELTTAESIRTNELRQSERKAIKKQNVEAAEAILALERQEADARAKQAREIATVQARETAETQRVQAEENRKAAIAQIQADEEVQVGEEAKQRQVEVARKNRERIVLVESERVEKDRMLEAISRERETNLAQIAKEKEIEVQRKEIADVIRSRIVVDKTVAEEEERIKDLRAIAEAKRTKEVQVTAAEARAQEELIGHVRLAEAEEEVAKFKAKQKITLAEADVEASDRQARAKIRLAEGVQAEAAARGLADVRVKEAHAVALEKEGLAQASVTRHQMLAEAQGDQEKGLAAAKVKEADAAAREKLGTAEAVAVRERLNAEAEGLRSKADAMKLLDGVGREHEEFRLKLEKERDIDLAEIKVRKDIAEARATILKEAFEHAKINIVGGDGAFFDQFIRAVSLGQSADGLVDQSATLQKLFGDYLSGNANLPNEILKALPTGSKELQNLSVAAFLSQAMLGADGATRAKLERLIEKARELGLDVSSKGVN